MYIREVVLFPDHSLNIIISKEEVGKVKGTIAVNWFDNDSQSFPNTISKKIDFEVSETHEIVTSNDNLFNDRIPRARIVKAEGVEAYATAWVEGKIA